MIKIWNGDDNDYDDDQGGGDDYDDIDNVNRW